MTSRVNNKTPSLDDDKKAPSLDDDDDKKVKIKIEDTKAKTTFTVPIKIARISELIENAIANDNSSEPVIELSKEFVSDNILKLVVEYMELAKGTEPEIIPPLKSTNLADLMTDANAKYAKFIDDIDDLSKDDLYKIIQAANYMNIKSLVHLGCAKIASKIKGQPLDKIKKILGEEKEEEEEKGEEKGN